MRGEGLAPHVIKASPTLWLLATCLGYDLYNLGPYPCIYPSFQGSLGTVPGEYIEVEDLTSLLPILDEIEEFWPNNLQGSTYLRVPVEVTIFDGRIRTAWAYVAPKLPTAPRIQSNDWRQHIGRREEIMMRIASGHLDIGWQDASERLMKGSLTEFELAEQSGKFAISFGGL